MPTPSEITSLAVNLNLKIDEVMNDFEFKKVKSVMEFLDWTWSTDTGHRTPSLDELRSTARRLLKSAVEMWFLQGRPASGMSVSIGGFVGEIVLYADDEARMSPKVILTFYVDQRDA